MIPLFYYKCDFFFFNQKNVYFNIFRGFSFDYKHNNSLGLQYNNKRIKIILTKSLPFPKLQYLQFLEQQQEKTCNVIINTTQHFIILLKSTNNKKRTLLNKNI